MNAQEFGLKPGLDLKEGDYCVIMQELRGRGLIPWGTENAMDGRNEVPLDHSRWHKYIDTDFGIAGSKSHIYLMPHSARLHAVTEKTPLTAGGLPLRSGTVKMYHRSDLILGRDMEEEDARTSPVWLDFADNDQVRLDLYVEKAFGYGKSKGWKTMMGIYVPEDEAERAVVLGRLDVRSRAIGLNHLDDVARLVGVPGSEATEAPAGRGAKNSPYRKDPRSELEAFLQEQQISREQLAGAVELYKTVKKLKL